MDWDRFHFLCRHYQASPERLLPDNIDRLQKGELTACGSPLKERSVGLDLLRQIRSLPAERAGNLLHWYGGQSFTPLLVPPPRIRGAMLYLSAISLVLIAMVVIYQLAVLPSMRGFYASVEVPGSAPAFALIGQGSVLLLLALLALALVWWLVWQVRRLYRFPAPAENSVLLRMMPAGIGHRYRELVELLSVPVATAAGRALLTPAAKEYQSYCPDPVPGPELLLLVRRKADELAHRVTVCLQFAVAIVGFLIALGVGFFLVGAYSPIFSTGAIV